MTMLNWPYPLFATKRKAGAAGTILSLKEFDKRGELCSLFAGIVGQNGIKADTWYRLEGGKLVEAQLKENTP